MKEEISSKNKLIYLGLLIVAFIVYAISGTDNGVVVFNLFYALYEVATSNEFIIFFIGIIILSFFMNKHKKSDMSISDEMVLFTLKTTFLFIAIFIISAILTFPFEEAIKVIEKGGDDLVGWYSFSDISRDIYEYKEKGLGIYMGPKSDEPLEMYLSLNKSFPFIASLSVFILVVAAVLSYKILTNFLIKKEDVK